MKEENVWSKNFTLAYCSPELWPPKIPKLMTTAVLTMFLRGSLLSNKTFISSAESTLSSLLDARSIVHNLHKNSNFFLNIFFNSLHFQILSTLWDEAELFVEFSSSRSHEEIFIKIQIERVMLAKFSRFFLLRNHKFYLHSSLLSIANIGVECHW